MKFDVLICPICGNQNLEIEHDRCKCPYCDSVLHVDYCKDIVENINSLLESDKECDLKNLRNQLSFELKNTFLNVDRIIEICNDLLLIIPKDTVARFIKAFLERNTYRLTYEKLIKELSKVDIQPYEMNIILPLMVKYCDRNNQSVVVDFLNAKNLYEDYKLDIEEALKDREEEMDRFYGQKDIFICHKSDDIEVVRQIAKILEENDCSCWYSERNLPFDTKNYWDNITDAIRNCKLFLFVLSNKSKLSHDALNEVKIASNLNIKKRLEYRIDSSTNNIPLKQFFNGIEWIDASKESKFEYLAELVYQTLNEDDIEEVKQEDIKNDEEDDNLDEAINNAKLLVLLKRYDEAIEEITKIIPNDINNPHLWELLLEAKSRGEKIITSENDAIFEHLLTLLSPAEQNALRKEYNVPINKIQFNENETKPKGPLNSLKQTFKSAVEDFKSFAGFGAKKEEVKVDMQKLEEVDELIRLRNDKAYAKLADLLYLDHAYYQYLVGKCYDLGIGVEQSKTDAFNWFEKSSKQGFVRARNALANCYFNGSGVNQSYEKAFDLYKKSAAEGSAVALYNIGVFYYNGIYVGKSFAEAVVWYRKAAEKGYAKAQYAYGYCYYYGKGVKQSFIDAAKWYEKAATQGSIQAMDRLADMYKHGHGVVKDLSIANTWEKRYIEEKTKVK